MQLTYRTRKLEKALTDDRALLKTYGALAAKIRQRMAEFEAAATLSDIRNLPAAGCHELSGDRAGYLAVKISGNYRLVFSPDHDPHPARPDGGLDWTAVTLICIEEITDYH